MRRDVLRHWSRSVRLTVVRRRLFVVALAPALLVLAVAGPAGAEPQTVEVRDAGGEPWQVVIDPLEAPRLALQTQSLALQAPDPAADEPPAEPVPVEPVPEDAAEGADAEGRGVVVREPRVIRTEEHGVEVIAVERADSAYAAIYRSIPFSRAEYDAYPSYRHDATMELLTGNPRPPRCCPPAPPIGPYPGAGYAPFGYGPFGHSLFNPYYGIPYRVFPYPAFGYKSRRYPVARTVFGVNYNLWHPTPGVFRHW
jgi:hypothetical protein